MAKSSQFGLRPAQALVHELVDGDDRGRGRVADDGEIQRLADVPEDACPVVEQVLIADEDARAFPRRALREERLVEPAGCAADVALPMPVRALLRVDDGRGVA